MFANLNLMLALACVVPNTEFLMVLPGGTNFIDARNPANVIHGRIP